jgi:hypothetical protein
MLRILLLITFCSSLSFAQTYTSTIRGSVKDADTGLPLANATVQLTTGNTGTTSNKDGDFRFDNLPVGRYILTVSFLGYETVKVPEILLESGKESVQQIKLNPTGQQLKEATVVSSRPVAFNSVQTITIEQTLRYAATYLDPARVATSFAGVAAAHDQANGLVIRGNSPNGMQWRLEGVEIVNPNHLSNAGTFSDRSTQTGGGVNILSTQLLGNSYFMSGAFPAQYGNALSGILDMNLRKGNDEKTEFVAQASLIGLDLAAEGPFSNNSKASYVANYRYSFTGLLGAMGVDFGGEINRFQDLSFNINLPTTKAGTFTVFGLGGISSNTFTAERDSSLWEFQKDGRDIIFKNKMGAIGATSALPIGTRTALNTTIVASGLSLSRQSFNIGGKNYSSRVLSEWDEQSKSRISLSSYLTHRFSQRSRLKVGLYATQQSDAIFSNSETPLHTRRLTGFVIQPFADWTYQITASLTSEIGVHNLFYSNKNGDQTAHSNSFEPRAAFRWQASASQQLSLSYGLHSQIQLPQAYMATISNLPVSYYGNLSLKPSKSHHFVLGYQKFFSKDNSLKVEAYLQELYNVAISADSKNSFSAINLVESYVNQKLSNKGTGRNYGVEATYQKLLTDQFYLLLSGSVYKATYVGSDGIKRNGRFDGGHTFSLTTGKEFKTRRQSIWGVNVKALVTGGFRDTPINLAESQKANATVYIQDQAFSIKMKEYFRPDLRIYWKKSKTRYSRTLAIDFQNVAGVKNDAFSYYDTFQKKIVLQHQLGMIPVLSYRWEF